MKIYPKFIVLWFFMIIGMTSGCMNVAISGAQAVYNRQNIQNTINDHYITMQINRSIYWNSPRYNTSHVDVTTFNRVVVLTGQTPSPQLQHDLEKIAKNVDGVKTVYNFTEVATPTSMLTTISDAWITTKIKTLLIASEVDPAKVKVVTENGTVFLMGIVFPDEAKIATQIARTTDGVQHVVRMFSYLHISNQMA